MSIAAVIRRLLQILTTAMCIANWLNFRCCLSCNYIIRNVAFVIDSGIIIIIVIIIIITVIRLLLSSSSSSSSFLVWSEQQELSLGPQYNKAGSKSDDYVPIWQMWQVKEKCLKTLSEYRKQRCRCHVTHVCGRLFHNLAPETKQEAQLPQRNSASAAHVKGARPSSPLPLRPLWLHLCVWSNSKANNVRTSSVPSTKRTFRWIVHSRSFKLWRSSLLVSAGIQNGVLS